MNDPINDRTNDQSNDADWWASRLVDQEIAFADVPADLRGTVRARAEEFSHQRRALLRLGVDHRVDPDVVERAVTSATNPSTAVVLPMRRRLAPFVGVAAAAAAVLVVGVSVLRTDDRPDVVTVDANVAATKAVEVLTTGDDAPAEHGATTEAAPPVDGTALAMTIDTAAPETSNDTEPIDPASARAPMPAEITEIADMIELAEYLRRWQATPPALLDGPAACEDDEGRPAIAVNVRFAGIDAQAFFSPDAGVMLRAVADCLKLASLAP